MWDRFFSALFPLHEISLELLIGNVGPIPYKLFSFLSCGKRRLGEIPLDLGNVYLLAGRIHEEINGIQHSELERQLLMFLDIIVSIFLCAVANLFGRPMSSIGQNISYSLPPDNPVEQPVESSLVIVGHSGEVLVG